MSRLAAAMMAAALLPAPAFAAFPQDPPNDPLFDASPLPGATNEQWDIQEGSGIGASGAWPLSIGAGERIAQIDLGVEVDHPDLRDSFCRDTAEAQGQTGVDDDRNGFVDDVIGWDFYDRDADVRSDTGADHGTNVGGVLAARADNGIGIAGIAPGACQIAVRTADGILHQGHRLAQAVVYATDRGARSISMSLGAESFPSALRTAVRYAHRRGAVIAVASGNEFHFHHHQPQLFDEVLAVGGVTPNTADLADKDPGLALFAQRFDTRAHYSDYGPHLDVVAPTQVPTTHVNGGFRMTWSGTSASAPHAAATAALVRARGRALGLELTAGEVIQLIRMTATDLTDPAEGEHAGWDVKTGWGRVDAAAAVRRVGTDSLPPDANILTPEWYEPVGPGFSTVEVRGFVRGRSATSWTLEAGSGEDPSSWAQVGRGETAGSLRRPAVLARIPRSALPRGAVTLRLRATDSRGNAGEDRVFFRVLGDGERLRPGFPVALGSAGESSPQLADLDGDRRDEIVLALADGTIAVRSGRSGRVRKGWPRRMRATAGSRPVARRIGTVRPGFLGTPAVGNVVGSARPEIIAAGLDGRVYGWRTDGKPLRGFPVRIAISRPQERGQLDAAIYASPALADLNGDGRLDIVVAASDQRVYVWDGRGRTLVGWPVLVRDGSTGMPGKIAASPAIGDIDGDHSLDVVVSSAEAYGSTPLTSGRIHAFYAAGRPKPGWPVAPSALAANSIPLVGQGVPGGAVLADLDGDGADEVLTPGAFTGMPTAYRGDGTEMPNGETSSAPHFANTGRGAQSSATAPAALALGANAVVAPTRPGGPLRFFSGLVDYRLVQAQLLPAQRVYFEHLMGGWDAASGAWLGAFPRAVEGWQIVSAPAVADVDGDGTAEVIAGGSGNVLHAFSEGGGEPAGWPKRPEGWLLAAPAAGDVDGDGLLEVVAVTRAGQLFAWDTDGRSAPWPSLRGNARNTGAYRR